MGNNTIKDEWCMSLKMIAYFQLVEYGKIYTNENGDPIADRVELAKRVKEDKEARENVS